MELPVCGEKII